MASTSAPAPELRPATGITERLAETLAKVAFEKSWLF
jgi:hypothetical protein